METNCTDTEMRKVLNRTLVLVPYPNNNNNNSNSQNEVSSMLVSLDIDSRKTITTFFMIIIIVYCSAVLKSN